MTIEFSDGSVHAASVVFTNSKAMATEYTARLFLALATNLNTPINTPVEKEFIVPAQGQITVAFDNVQVPLITSQYVDYTTVVQVLYGGTVIHTFVGADVVRAIFTPSIGWGGITWS